MRSPTPVAKWLLAAPLRVAAGLLLAAMAWVLPVNLKSVTPALLAEAGGGTSSVAELGRQLVDAEKIGPADLVFAAAQAIEAPQAPPLAAAVKGLAQQQAGVVA